MAAMNDRPNLRTQKKLSKLTWLFASDLFYSLLSLAIYNYIYIYVLGTIGIYGNMVIHIICIYIYTLHTCQVPIYVSAAQPQEVCMPLSSLLAEPEVDLLWWGIPEVYKWRFAWDNHGTASGGPGKKWNIIYKWWFKLVYPLVFKKLQNITTKKVVKSIKHEPSQLC